MIKRYPRPASVEVYRPYDEQVPTELLDLTPDSPLDYVRVAKLGDTLLGAYEMVRLDQFRFKLIKLIVLPQYRGRGIGVWLIKHAQALAESKGGMTLECEFDGIAPLLETLGFKVSADGAELAWRFTVTPE
ncbi:MAG: GNAT family N-acetyltransferase [Pseudomonadaceae bacterium]|nr:GNAT family N-acetyltransferase [Pseudomonadaceae bacterium]